MNKTIEERLTNYLSRVTRKSKENRLNISAWVYSLATENKESSLDIIQYFLEKADYIATDDSIEPEHLYSLNDLNQLKKTYGKLVNSILETLLIKNPIEDVFYNELWHSIIQTPALDTNESQVFALYYIWIDARIPFFHLPDGMYMSNQRFKELSNTLEEQISKARFIIFTSKFTSRTERAKVLLGLLDSVDDDEQRTVLMAHTMALLTFSLPADTADAIHSDDMPDDEGAD